MRHCSVVCAGLLLLCGCVNVAPRPDLSSYGCMRAMRDSLPSGLSDKHAHCLASGLIARHCSIGEAYLAGAGKELRDLAGFGDAEWADWKADRIGINCATQAREDADVEACCARSTAAMR